MDDRALNVFPGEAQPEQLGHGEGRGKYEDRLEGQGRLAEGQGPQHEAVQQEGQQHPSRGRGL